MFGWVKFVGLRFWISKISLFRKGNFPLRFQYRAICKSWFRQYFLLKTKNSLQSSPFTVVSLVLSLHHISSVLCLNASVSQGLALFFVFALLHLSSFFIAIPGNYSPLPSLNLWYRFGLHHIYILNPLPLNSSGSQGLALFFVFALLRLSSFFIAIPGNYSPLPIFEFTI